MLWILTKRPGPGPQPALVVRAPDITKARKLAAIEAGDMWLDPGRTFCQALRTTGQTGVIVRKEG